MKNNNTNPENIKNSLHEAVTFIGDVYAELETLRKENKELKARLGESETSETNNTPAFDCLAVTYVQVFPFKEGPSLGHMKGLAQIVINDQLVIRGLRIMDGEYGLYVGYPNDPFYKGDGLRSVCNPITRQLREHIEACVLEKYDAAIGDNEKED